MPTISIFFGIVVQMYYRDHLPPRARRLVCDWVLSRQAALSENWELARRMRALRQVPGADVT
ncbi:hypothetical protein EDC65_0041 [Stella humosa]|uniref:Uncharacterized protein n=1 Tax=Stella humosa TaxID=94 RepID=A0A3N1MJ53_9PROT|nr:hypothetical protein [Stella humosa]ROQ03359.1 hypothetical protein EDC65_0041 [Stella humosa]BBK29646.1 hypothetical protein STHU_02800 [Stella humosa]